ncbi:MAG: pyruvate kinase, partial [Bacteroidales bacterium]|nr:pyruvate kinase [Bacteroidales bacterium]
MRKKRTKIVATISDKKCDPDFISELYKAGMDVVRINSAHLDIEGALKIVGNVRMVSDKIAILIDTKGPEIRTTICDAPVELRKGTTVMMAGNPGEKTTGSLINVSYRKFVEEVPEGCEILIDDGDICLRAVKRNGSFLECVVEDGGML